MPTVTNRRFGRNNDVVASSGATHIIKIGFKNQNNWPDKTNGFYIAIDALDNNGEAYIDYDAMEILGYDPKTIDRAIQAGFKGEDGALPRVLHFILMNDARRENGAWNFGEIFNDSFECYPTARQVNPNCDDKTPAPGLWCHGNGETAMRKQPDGTKIRIECVPFGRQGSAADDFCPFSGPDRPCKTHLRIIVCLYVKKSDGSKALVSPNLGMQARFRVDSTSDYCAMQATRQLTMGAERLDGRLNGITGTLMFQKRRRRTGGQGKAAGVVAPHIHLVLDEESIRAREREMAEEVRRRFDRRLEAARSGLMIEAPPEVIHEAEPIASGQPTHRADPIKTGNAHSMMHPAGRAPVLDDRDDSAEDDGDDLPFEDDAAAETPGRILVADATDSELMEALDICRCKLAADADGDVSATLKSITKVGYGGKIYAGVMKLESLVTTDPEKAEKASAHLRQICVALEERGQRHFIVIRETPVEDAPPTEVKDDAPANG